MLLAMCCCVMNAISVLSQTAGKVWSCSPVPKSTRCINVKKDGERSRLCIFHYCEDEKAAAESRLSGSAASSQEHAH